MKRDKNKRLNNEDKYQKVFSCTIEYIITKIGRSVKRLFKSVCIKNIWKFYKKRGVYRHLANNYFTSDNIYYVKSKAEKMGILYCYLTRS